MIAFLRGAVLSVENESVVLDVQGVGFRVNVTAACAASLSGMVAQEASLHTHLIVREDDLQLYGFFSPDEIRVFLLLLGVNGVGPRAALGVLSQLTPQGLVRAVTLEDVLTLTRAPGVGKKIAQRIVLELKDKVVKSGLAAALAIPQENKPVTTSSVQDALTGLLALGYGAVEAREALSKIEGASSMDASELIKFSLHLLDKSR